MDLLDNFNFAEPWWLLGLLVPLLLPLLPAARGLLSQRYKDYADAELIPHLLLKTEQGSRRRSRRFALWSLLWCLGCLAMAGPRWDYRDVDLLKPGADLVVLLDMSRSMAVTDVRPSRLGRARQEIEDLLDRAEQLRVGIIAFASVAHVVAPITEDLDAVRHVLPALSTDLVQMGGSRLDQALHKAQRLLTGQPPGSVHSLLLISDGDFDEPGLNNQVSKLAAQGIATHVLAVGTPAGGRVPGPPPKRGWLTDRQGRRVVSRLNEPLLQSLAAAGGGHYQLADFRDDDSRALLALLQRGGEQDSLVAEGTRRIWHERYDWLVAAILLLMLPWFRRGERP